jgi:deoxyribodipyrimidine photo-lyase
MNKQRIRKLNTVATLDSGPVVYWMDRERRIVDNWALIAAYLSAKSLDVPLIIYYAIPDEFMSANLRTYDFMLKGLNESFDKAFKLNFACKLELIDPVDGVLAIVKQTGASAVFTDFSPLKLARKWRDDLSSKLNVPFYEVDARNIVPCWLTSNKLEFGARTIRPKIHKLLSEFLDDFPVLEPLNTRLLDNSFYENFEIDSVINSMSIDKSVSPVDTFIPGENAGLKVLKDFIQYKLTAYDTDRNDPNKNAISNLSPYLHYGQISSQRCVLDVNNSQIPDQFKEVFVEEIVVRRELADNFCFYCPNYDSIDCAWDWAKTTLNQHSDDEREYLYELDDFEKALTHDPLWNAAQKEMVKTGKMHGFMRMYWAKKILEWTASPKQAFEIAIYLNNKYELDGRDSNGYTGVAWSICGVHDRAWFERPVFGKIRYMNYNGCKRKFDVDSYIDKIKAL